ncbi:hypothetical protein MGMO_18c00010 [Methyloglobulus morosus KoM1]|uniref:Fibronectin type-III domain-containing protein n=2 Tax=Methyloglobulus TaxID=1410680 RepID=V5C9L3_9GAMM|nr:hypothetical protein MGMO_18c00010 [Methyloglobulus morosus KoM1]
MDWENQYMPYLLSVVLNQHSIERQVINTLISAQAMRCVVDTSSIEEEAQNWIFNGCDKTQVYFKLIAYGNYALERFKLSTDRVNRVLKFNDILKNKDKLKEHIDEMGVFFISCSDPIETFPSHQRPWKQDIDHAIAYIKTTEHELLRAAVLDTSQASPTKPVLLEGKFTKSNKIIHLTWTAPKNGDHVIAYKVKKLDINDDKADDWILVDISFTLQLTLPLSTNKKGVKMQFQVIPFNRTGDGPPSNIATVVI